jgi:hypothetical protein
MTQALLDEHAMGRLHLVGIQAGENQQIDGASVMDTARAIGFNAVRGL